MNAPVAILRTIDAGFARAFARLRAVRAADAQPRRDGGARRSSTTCAGAATGRCSRTRGASTACALTPATLRVAPDELARPPRGAAGAGARRAAPGGAAHPRLSRCASGRRRGAIATRPACMLGQQITPLRRVGVYVPGGHAAYPSSVLMNVIPARVAGVDEVIMVSPAGRDGSSRRGARRGAHRRRDARCTASAARRRSRRWRTERADDPARRQDRRAGQRLRAGGQAAGLRPGRHRLDRRAERGAGDRRCAAPTRPTSPPICSPRPSTAAATSARCC